MQFLYVVCHGALDPSLWHFADGLQCPCRGTTFPAIEAVPLSLRISKHIEIAKLVIIAGPGSRRNASCVQRARALHCQYICSGGITLSYMVCRRRVLINRRFLIFFLKKETAFAAHARRTDKFPQCGDALDSAGQRTRYPHATAFPSGTKHTLRQRPRPPPE